MTDLKNCDVLTLARIISSVENDDTNGHSILENLQPSHEIPVIGITGPPGAGKSTLINALITAILNREKELIKGRGIGIIAVDPSSAFTQGALLGDRLRMSRHFNNPKVFIRSLATRGSLGGLSAKAIEVTDVMRSAGFDFIFIETVGIGQSEAEIASLADMTVLVLVPESGDEVQTMKAGIMEMADVFVVNKSDRAGAEKMAQYIISAATIAGKPKPEVISTTASTGNGVDDLLKWILEKRNIHHPDKSESLLLDKTVRIISQRLITDADIIQIKTLLKNSGNQVNIYRIAADFIRSRSGNKM